MTTIAVSELRANFMKVLTEVKHGAHIQITSHGKVVAQLVPASNAQEKAQATLQQLRSTAFIGDVVSPLDEPWNVLNS